MLWPGDTVGAIINEQFTNQPEDRAVLITPDAFDMIARWVGLEP